MAFTTLSGFTISQVGSNGQIQIGDSPYTAPAKTDWQGLFGDFFALARKGILSGVIAGGVCTASGLTITVPSGTTFIAGGQYWTSATSTTVSVSDATTTYIFACQDGELRTSASTTPPTGYDDNRSFLLTVATATAGTATLDNTQQQKARVVNQTDRTVCDNNAGISPQCDTIPVNTAGTIPNGSQWDIFDSLTILGSLTIQGKVRVS